MKHIFFQMKQLHFLPGTQDQLPFLNPSAFTEVFWGSMYVQELGALLKSLQR